MPVVLYECETLSLTLREELRLRVFEEDIWAQEGLGNRRIEKTTLRGALCCVLLTKYYTSNQIKNNEMGGARSTHERQKSCIEVLVGRPEEKRPLG